MQRAATFTTQRHAGLHEAGGDGEHAGEQEERQTRHDCEDEAHARGSFHAQARAGRIPGNGLADAR